MEGKICALDIDGVLNTYPDCWVDFVNAELNTNYRNLNELKDSLSYSTYKTLKYKYRSSGYKRDLPVREGAAEFTKALKELGYEVLILTSRPFNKYPNLRFDTIHWLDTNNIEYNSLICSEDKHIEIISKYPQLSFMVEDNRHFANNIARYGCKVFLVDNEYNQGIMHSNVKRINELSKIIERVKEQENEK